MTGYLQPETFRSRAIPELRRVIQVHARRIVGGTETADVATRATWRIAEHLGADRLDPCWRGYLSDWIKETLERSAETERARLVTETRY